MMQTMRLFLIGLRQIRKDGMLAVLVPAPVFAGLLFKLAVPYVNAAFEANLRFSLRPWYGLVDGLLICLAPMMTAVVSAFVLLDEQDEGTGAYYRITPAGDYSYLAARIGLPMVWAFGITAAAAAVFNISGLSFAAIVTGSLISTFTGAALAMMIATLAANRVEGLAVSKFTGISFIGLVLVWFVPPPYVYCSAVLPSFWIGKIMIDGASPVLFAAGTLVCLAWTAFFTGKFRRRLGG